MLPMLTKCTTRGTVCAPVYSWIVEGVEVHEVSLVLHTHSSN
jgi:hypothetical protein